MLLQQVEQNLLLANDFDGLFLHDMVNKLMSKRIDFCDIYLQHAMGESFAIDEGIVKSGSFSADYGVGVRAICNDKSFLSYTNLLNSKVINNLVENIFVEPVAQIVSPAELAPYSNQIPLYGSDNPIYTMASEEKTALLRKIDQLGRECQYVTNVIANISFEYDEICIINSNLNIMSDVRPLIHLSITIIVNKNGKVEKGSSGFGGRDIVTNVLTNEMIKQHVERAYAQAILKIDAVEAPFGQMPVVLGNGWAAVILHEAVGHGLEGDFNRRGSSAFTNRIGQQVASSQVTVIDEGCIPNRRGSLTIDDEGNPTQKTVLIENGILCGYMFDELNSRLMGTKSTGNGRRESFACSPMPRMTNTYMQNGKHEHEEIIASVDHGIYAENFEGGQVDITSGQFVFNANVAWVINHGKLAYPVKGFALVGNGPECLKHVSMVGNNSILDPGVGVCGKNGQSVPVGVGQPTIRIDSGLVVGGG
ncbi:MAG: metalloprotease TldD [Burkholderiales bacterium]|nr:metalloprotease TldD [Burkholderiales bacterium]